MSEINVPKLMNGLISDLQSEAWSLGAKLVADISTEMTLDCEVDALRSGLTRLISTLLHKVRAGSSISLVTACETPAPGLTLAAPPDEGETAMRPAPAPPVLVGGRRPAVLRVRIEAPLTASPDLDRDLANLEDQLAGVGGTLEVAHTERAWQVVLTLPHARLVAPVAAETPQRTAVVVDDDTDTQDFLRAILESSGFRVISVSDGFDALLVVERYRPQVVMTDILMPNMNGIDLVGRLRQACPDIPVIVFSGYRDALIKSIAGLPDRILPKPMTRDQVLAALQGVLEAK